MIFPINKVSLQLGFSLIELITVMILIGIIGTTVSFQFKSSDLKIQAAKSDVIAALVFARETAMARTGGSSSIRFIAKSRSIDVQVNNASISSIYQQYPLFLQKKISISAGTGSVYFNSLGEATPHSLTLSQDTISLIVNISGVGYAY